ncbi:hypothetical protein [Devosia sp. SD17-2]|uniref:hypothetical protein n=1 Tax=Devosia sp. SD17-2 TaxID=2976459 RepID=UPI0023D834E8|nr:hypothetical protein [Devosia sp. SD17-2]WEJ31713.1 hypothetical protein NYQ88_12440 [Devosia sp. SD17-2]
MDPLRKTPSEIACECPLTKSEGVRSGAIKLAVLGAFLIVLAGCAHSTPSVTSNCAGWRQINPTSADIGVISDPLAGEILSHNEHGSATCGWQPPTLLKATD